MHPAQRQYGGRCYLHSDEHRRAEAHAAKPVERREAEPLCKTVSAGGWPCPYRAAQGFDHCMNHLRGELRAGTAARSADGMVGPRQCQSCARRGSACAKHGGEPMRRCGELTSTGEPCARWAGPSGVCKAHQRRDARTRVLEEECGRLRLQVRELEGALDRAYAELDFAKAVKKPATAQHVNGRAMA